MEVFIAYTPDDEITVLEQTLQAWAECEDAEPIMVEIPKPRKFELIRRITAENMAHGRHYILADLGCIPEAPDLIRAVVRKLYECKDGLVGLYPVDAPADCVPVGVRVCEKGAVKHWVSKRTPTYNEEHAESVRRSGKSVEIWPDIQFKHLAAC